MLLSAPVSELEHRAESTVELLSVSLWFISEKRLFPRTRLCDRFRCELLGIRFVSPLVTCLATDIVSVEV